MLAVIGGSGLAALAVAASEGASEISTPYGSPSGPLRLGRMAGQDVAFLLRHGNRHAIPPHEINYRANIWALREAGAREVISVATVGGIRATLGPGALAVPGQIIDYTHGRAATFGEAPGGGVCHVDFTHPYCESLRQRLLAAAATLGEPVIAGGVYAATQGPRLETAAEIDRLERDGADMVGMTGMPEAVLAREAGLCYAVLAVVVNAAAGRGASAEGISLETAQAVLRSSMGRVSRILERVADDGH